MGKSVRQTVRRAVCRNRDTAEDAKSIAYRLLMATAGSPRLHDLALLLDREVGRLSAGLNELAVALRGEADGSQLTFAV